MGMVKEKNMITPDQIGVAMLSEQGYTEKALTKSSAIQFCQITIPTSSFCAFLLVYAIRATDGTDFQVRAGSIIIVAVNKAGTLTTAVGVPTTASEQVAVSAGTLTNTFTAVDGTGGVLQLKANAVPSITPGAGQLVIDYKVIVLYPNWPANIVVS